MDYLDRIPDVDASDNSREISIEEMPQGCFLHKDGKTILIASPWDAEAICLSLIRMIQIQHPEYKAIDYEFSSILERMLD